LKSTHDIFKFLISFNAFLSTNQNGSWLIYFLLVNQNGSWLIYFSLANQNWSWHDFFLIYRQIVFHYFHLPRPLIKKPLSTTLSFLLFVYFLFFYCFSVWLTFLILMLLFIVILCVWRILWFLIQNWCLYVLCLLPDSYFGLGSQSREKKKCITYQLEYILSIYFYVVFVFGNDVYQFYWLLIFYCFNFFERLIFYCYRARIKVMYNIKFLPFFKHHALNLRNPCFVYQYTYDGT